MNKKIINRNTLSIFVFLGIVSVIFLIGIISVPYLTKKMTQTFLKIQTDVNDRQAKNISGFIERKIQLGESITNIIDDVQILIKDSQSERGYTCVIDSISGNFISHPMIQNIGMPISSKNANFTENSQKIINERWEKVVQRKESLQGTLIYNEMLNEGIPLTESVAMISLNNLNLTVSTHENISRIQQEIKALQSNIMVGAILIGFFIAIPSTFLSRKISKNYESQILKERDKHEKLLLNILPKSTIEEINKTGISQPKKYNEVSVLFLDIVGYTDLASKMTPQELIRNLNIIFNKFDFIVDKYQVEKIKTIGDAYMVCAGAPIPVKDHADRLIELGKELLVLIKLLSNDLDLNIDIRIGINSGEIIAGIIGTKKFAYDLWGDTVNIASRMESTGVINKIQVSESTYELTKHNFDFIDRGEIPIKGKGKMKTYLLTDEFDY